MRLAFLLATLFVSAVYAYMAFAGLSFLSSTGRLGPGFFPRIVGTGLVLTSLYCVFTELRQRQGDGEPSAYRGTVVVIAILSGVFVGLLNVLGGVLAMVVFLLMTLSVLNRGGHMTNVAVSIVLPVAVFMLFRVWLNASMPRGIIPLPI